MTDFDAAGIEIQAAVSKAHALRSRGDAGGADRAIAEVLEKYPDHPAAMEAHAESLADAGKLTEARDAYGKVIAAHPGRIATERRHAEIVLRLAQRDQVVRDMDNLHSLMNPIGVKRNAGTASFFSLIAPGFGQIYNGELIKGLIMLGTVITLWVLLFTVGYVRFSETDAALNVAGYGCVILLFALYITAIVDAAVSAPKSAGPAAPERPKPPVDKPFE